ncbi:MAG: hypothetical protein IJ391_09190 [Clostridia bacterium]|nr:hypothetical protein [Clostridia bacterium]
MNKKILFRIISLAMFIIAVIFVFCALSAPNLGTVFYIGNIKIGVEVWRVFYAVYTFVTVGLFVLSFFVDNKWMKK